MSVEDFINQFQKNARLAETFHKTTEEKQEQLQNIFKETLEYKKLNPELLETLSTIEQLKEINEKCDIDLIRLKQQKAKEEAKNKQIEQGLLHVVNTIQKGVSQKDEMKIYHAQLKNYLIRRITGVNLNMEESKMNGNVSGWISNIRTSSFEVFKWKKDEKTENEARNFLWDMTTAIDKESYNNWHKLFND